MQLLETHLLLAAILTMHITAVFVNLDSGWNYWAQRLLFCLSYNMLKRWLSVNETVEASNQVLFLIYLHLKNSPSTACLWEQQ